MVRRLTNARQRLAPQDDRYASPPNSGAQLNLIESGGVYEVETAMKSPLTRKKVTARNRYSGKYRHMCLRLQYDRSFFFLAGGLATVTVGMCLFMMVYFHRTVTVPDDSASYFIPHNAASTIQEKIRESRDAWFGRQMKASSADSFFFDDKDTMHSRAHPREIHYVIPTSSLSKDSVTATATILAQPPDLSGEALISMNEFDNGELEIAFFAEDGFRRAIYKDFSLQESIAVHDSKEQDDDVTDTYYAMDDDRKRGEDTRHLANNTIDETKRCRRQVDHRLSFSTCNTVHEMSYVAGNAKYLGEGAYRQVFSLQHDLLSGNEMIVIKDLHYENEVEYDNFEYIRMDALVADRLTSSRRTFDIYGFCSLGILSEFFTHGDFETLVIGGHEGYLTKAELNDGIHLKPKNDLTPVQKLVTSLEMAEGLAELHGFRDGLIIHDDVQLSQYLFNKEKTVLKLNDFNRAEFVLYDEKNQEYCRYKNGRGHGNWRSPEEYKNHPLTEKIDVWSLGNNIYSTLTGLYPFYDNKKHRKVVELMKNKKTGYIDSRYHNASRAEDHLATLIKQCWTYEEAKRPNIFDIVRNLQKAVQECLAPGETRLSVLASVPEKNSFVLP